MIAAFGAVVAHAESFFQNYLGSAVTFRIAATTAFQASGTNLSSIGEGAGPDLRPVDVAPGKTVTYHDGVTNLTFLGAPTNSLYATNTVTFTSGDTNAPDSFAFSTHIHADAKSALVDGKPANGRVDVDWAINIPVSPLGGAASIVFSSLPSTNNGTFSFQVHKFKGYGGEPGSGVAAGQVLALDLNYNYIIELHTTVEVVNGEDPVDLNVDASGTISMEPFPQLPYGAAVIIDGHWLMPIFGTEPGRPVVFETSTDLSTWTPVQTNQATSTISVWNRKYEPDLLFSRAVSY